MKNKRGFILLELIAVFLLAGILLAAVYEGYGLSLRAQQRYDSSLKAYLLLTETAAAGQAELPPGWELRRQRREAAEGVFYDLMLYDGEKCLANMVRYEKR